MIVRRTGMRMLAGAAAALALTLGAHAARAQSDYPNRLVKMITPQGPGGGVDIVARLLVEQLTKRLGQSFIIDNQGGAGGAIASADTARAAPDGYTLMLAYVGTHGTNPAVRKTSYDAVRDFTPIAMIGGTPDMLVVTPRLKIKTLKEFVAYAKKNPGKLSYGTSGNGTGNHLVMEQFKHEANFEDLSVPYKSMGQAITDLIGGQIQTVFPGSATAMPHVRSGNVIALATTSETRQAAYPDVPTFKELGYSKLNALTWYGVAGPAKMPPAITNKLNAEINAILATPEFQKKLASLAIEPMPMSPAEFGSYIKNEIATWTRVAHDSNIHID
jgi:tripartite-type tricarboxylate transporter receptor subunit TctC